MARLSPFPARLALVAVLALAAGCARDKAAQNGRTSPGAPVVLVSIDTLRADHLPAYGYQAVATPHIDALRQDAILFANAYSHCPLTLPSHVSLLTGLLPPEHGVRNNIGYRLDGQAHPTLASLLKAKGYATGAAVSAYVLRRTTGIDTGFDFYGEVVTATGAKAASEVQRAGTETVRVALDWLRGLHDKRVFLFVHLYEPHTPYDPPEPFRSRYGATYDGEIAAADAAVGDLVGGLREQHLYDDALVVLVSDHGEGLGDHGEAEHGVLLYREALHVPLLVKLPRSERKGVTEDTPAGLRDVLPTIAAVVGLAKPAAVKGRSLLSTEGASTAAVYSETYYPRIHLGWSDLHSLVDARYHFIDGPRPELYDVVHDPAERSDQVTERTALAQSMRAALGASAGSFTAPADATSEEMEKLRSLGYLTAGAAPLAPGTSLPNPNEQIAGFTRMRAAFALVAQGKDEAALRMLDDVLAANPGLVDAQAERASTLARLGRYREAAAAYQKAIDASPTLAPSLSLTLGRMHLEMGDLKAAEEAARRAVASEPGPAHELLASVALARENLDEAEREARLVVTDTGAEARATVVLAEVLARRGEQEKALDLLAEAGRRNVARGLGPVPYFEFVRGDTLARLGRHAEAESALRAEIAAFPTHVRAYASLAIVAALEGRPLDESRHILEQMHRAQPRPQTALLAAKALDYIGDREGAAAWRRRAEQPASRRPL